MKPKTMILMGLAIVCGLGASYMTSRLLAERNVEEQEKVKILVAKRVLSVGERLAKPEELFEVKEVTRDNEPPDAIKDLDALKGKMMKQSRNKGDHVTLANLYESGGLDIPEGHQAVGCPVNLATTAAGLASLPGSRVDLNLTVRGNNPLEVTTITVLENVLVLAADARTSREGEIIAPASVVTFALKEKDRLTMVNAKEMGILSLSLRKLNDESKAQTTRVTGKTVLGIKDDPVVASTPRVTPPSVAEAVTPPTVEPNEPRYTNHSFQIVSPSGVTNVNYRRFENGEIHFDDGSNPPPAPQPRQQRTQPQEKKSAEL
jgi:pilus assembly protein CpaB